MGVGWANGTDEDLRSKLPTSEAAFVALLNTNLPGRMSALSASSEIALELESLELLVVWTLMDELGAELPAGIEVTMISVRDLYEHAVLRWGAEGLLS